jgi:hypothetical protein
VKSQAHRGGMMRAIKRPTKLFCWLLVVAKLGGAFHLAPPRPTSWRPADLVDGSHSRDTRHSLDLCPLCSIARSLAARVGYRLSLTHVAEGKWRAQFSTHPMLAPTGYRVAAMPWRTVQRPAWGALRQASADV